MNNETDDFGLNPIKKKNKKNKLRIKCSKI